MAMVNVDLSEYDAIRKRNSELEEQVKELKKLNDSLKQGAKVILRKKVVVETDSPVEPWRDSQIAGFREGVYRSNKRIVESSESYVNFEDVRLKVDLKKTYEKKEKDLEEKYARMTGNFEAERIRVRNKLPKIATMATDLRDELNKCFFKPKLAIKPANDIIDFPTKKN
nr:MAG TPA_asm: hypothetical protein [Caudoviricetes sp.]